MNKRHLGDAEMIAALEQHLQIVSQHREDLLEIAQAHLDRYWINFRLMNISIYAGQRRDHGSSGESPKPGRLAPRIKNHGGPSQHRTIEWCLYKGSPARLRGKFPNNKPARHSGEPIRMPTRGFSRETFKAKGCEDWEIENALQTEKSLSELRVAIANAQKTARSLRAQLKRLRTDLLKEQGESLDPRN